MSQHFCSSGYVFSSRILGVSCEVLGDNNAAFVVARVPQPRVYRFRFAGAVYLSFNSAVTVYGNTSFVGNSAGADGGDEGILNVRLECSCRVRLCVALRYKSSSQR